MDIQLRSPVETDRLYTSGSIVGSDASFRVVRKYTGSLWDGRFIMHNVLNWVIFHLYW